MAPTILKFAKRTAEKVPPSLGQYLSHIPFKYRLGRAYQRTLDQIGAFEGMSSDEKKEQIFCQMRRLVDAAYNKTNFYRAYYDERGFAPDMLKDFRDISRIPLVNKEALQGCPLERRATGRGIVSNTGGTSGQPLALLLDPEAYAREWAHMHSIWKSLGYKPHNAKLTVRGQNLGSDPLVYNFTQNEFKLNPYAPLESVFSALEKLIEKKSIEFIHGYPSSIYELTSALKSQKPELLEKVKRGLKGGFLGSEYPAPQYRDVIENAWGVETVSWYGHSEMAVLAPERDEAYVYHPFQTYGYAEICSVDGASHLIGSTIHNVLGPLIRYDTGDIVSMVSSDDGLLKSFKVTEGRVGEFVKDRDGRDISLTALIFGRHHKLFELASFVQVKQDKAGFLKVFVTSQNAELRPEQFFESSGISMTFDFEIVSTPFRTKIGKVPLLIK